MPVLQVAYKATAPKAVLVQLDGAAVPAQHVDAGSFSHPDPVYPGSVVLYHGVRDALYKLGVLDMSILNITLANDVTIPVYAVEVSPASFDLRLEDPLYQKGQIVVTVLPYSAGNKAVTFVSSDPAVATVSVTGAVEAVSNGYATITVTTTDGSKTATVGVSVGGVESSGEVESVELTPIRVTLSGSGQTAQLTAEVLPENATNKAVTYSTSNAAIATVSSTGLVTAVADTGECTITVTTVDGAKTDTSTITIAIEVTGVTLLPATMNLAIGGTSTGQLTATVAPVDATNDDVTYSTSNAAVATVSSTGLVTAVADGTATITVTTDDGDFTDTCVVTVTSV